MLKLTHDRPTTLCGKSLPGRVPHVIARCFSKRTDATDPDAIAPGSALGLSRCFAEVTMLLSQIPGRG
jgi:hypothetical protein